MNLAKQLPNIINTVALTTTLGLTLATNSVNAQTVRNADKPGRNPYQQTGRDYCPDYESCAFRFPPVPAGNRLVIQSVSVEVITISYPSGSKVATLYDGFNKVKHYVPLEYVGRYAGDRYAFVTNQIVQRYFDAGEQPIWL